MTLIVLNEEGSGLWSRCEWLKDFDLRDFVFEVFDMGIDPVFMF